MEKLGIGGEIFNIELSPFKITNEELKLIIGEDIELLGTPFCKDELIRFKPISDKAIKFFSYGK